MRAVIASGSGRYADPWHPFARTSDLVAEVLETAGFTTTIVHDVDRTMTTLDGADLLVVNAGDPWRAGGTDSTPAESIDGLAAALDRGIGVLALHSAVSSLRDYPEWAIAIGAMWVPGLSFHPPADVARITGGALPDGAEVPGFEVLDERYCRLQSLGRSHVVLEHEGALRAEPTAWVREFRGSRVAVDLLGHDEHSYESAGHRMLIAQLALWTVDRS